MWDSHAHQEDGGCLSPGLLPESPQCPLSAWSSSGEDATLEKGRTNGYIFWLYPFDPEIWSVTLDITLADLSAPTKTNESSKKRG